MQSIGYYYAEQNGEGRDEILQGQAEFQLDISCCEQILTLQQIIKKTTVWQKFI